MPNWCNNTVYLSHSDPKMIDRAEAAFVNGALLQEFIPCPQELLGTVSGWLGNTEEQRLLEAKQQANIEKYGYPTWYEWTKDNWGIKWDVGGEADQIDRMNSSSVSMSFDSAWAPPIDAYRALEEQGFKVCAYYNEPGMGFVGYWTADRDESWDYSFTKEGIEAIKKEIPQDVIDEFDLLNYVSEWIDEE